MAEKKKLKKPRWIDEFKNFAIKGNALSMAVGVIIGGGFSGSWAALTARQHVENVLIVDKGPRDWGGLGGMSGGDMIVKQPEFAAKDLVEELVYYYDGLCEQDVLEEILNQSYERFKDYEKMGHEFARDDSGRLMSIPQRGLELMRYYFYHPYGKGGAHTTQILNAELQRLNVQRIGRIEITDLVQKDGSFIRHLKASDTVGGSIRKSSFLMTEHFTLKKTLGYTA